MIYFDELFNKLSSLEAALIGLVVLTINPVITLDVEFYNVVFNVIVDFLKVICQLSISFLTIYLMILKIKNEKKNKKNE